MQKKLASAVSPIFHKSGSISGMKKTYYGRDACLCVVAVIFTMCQVPLKYTTK